MLPFFILLFFAGIEPLSAQGKDPASDLAMTVTVSIMAIVIAVLMYIITVMNSNIDPVAELYLKVKNYVIPPATEVVPDIGHVYDDIRELDNRIPPWFNYLFALTVLFGVIYMIDYHVAGTSQSSAEEYAEEMAAANLQRKIMMASGGTINENALTMLTDAEALSEGAENFNKFCVSCHGPQGGGLVGPNLTDEYWIHGGSIKNVYMTVKNGVPSKGMISWELVFSQKQILNLSSFVLSLQGNNPPGGKGPEGQKYVQPVATAPDSVKETSSN